MKPMDPFVKALIDLCEKEGDYKNVADKAKVSPDNLWQIINGTKLPSGNPRGVGPGLRGKLSAAFPDWLSTSEPAQKLSNSGAIDLANNPDYPSIRRVRFRLSAGASGFAVEYDGEDAAPIVFQRRWFEGHGYTPAKLFAARVANGSMEPGLYHDDTVVVNTADTNLKDGEVFAMNYEGELVIKRLMRDAGQWWLASDNPDQRRYPRKVCGDNVFCVGRIVHKQSEKI